ncbi:hypothetical protein YH65_07765 [Sulfurovum lithotrophicum]|uniref:Cytochrome c domain-containing protein n=1 Tax=Sulfurovum lithotrophicum TaxID=206403 RepID=A0A7U4RR13_9BACT|nr:cytochrome c [Sulfurovum lithotrophicum]AKF25297.1 hypothetical protein YH65_07765 [Sulfurovum lithotrophicum]
MKKVIVTFGLTAMIATSVFAGDPAQTLIEKNKCMSCHNIMGMKDAPPFAGIAWRNSRINANTAKATLKNSIKNGSHGKYPMFSNTRMPSFSHLSDKELDTLATWVLSQAQNMKCGQGKCGSSMNNKKGWW